MKKILVLTPRLPFPVIGGDKLRIVNLCRELKSNFSLSLLSLYENPEELKFLSENDCFDEIHTVRLSKSTSWLQSFMALILGKPIQLSYYWSGEFASKVYELVDKHDAVLSHLIRTAQYIDSDGFCKPRIIEMTDAISLNYQRIKEKSGKKSFLEYIYNAEQSRINKYEQDLLSKVDLTTVVSNVDREYLLRFRTDDVNVKVYGNGVDFSHLPYSAPIKSFEIAFIGNMGTAQNIDACLYFHDNVLPLILKYDKRFVLKIIGIIPPRVKRKFEKLNNVVVTGGVDCIKGSVGGCLCGMCSMRIGAGVQNKVLEYMSMGLPTVVSEIGVEGIDAVDGQDLLVSRSPEEMATHIIRLYVDDVFREMIAKNARAFIETNMGWPNALHGLVDEVGDIIDPVKLTP